MKTQAIWHSILQRLLTLPYLLSVITLMYFGVYLFLLYTPSNGPELNTLSWWGWFDQGEYLKAAKALDRLDFSADQYFYPPLYSALGAVFIVFSSNHPFFLINLICLLWFVFVFIRLCDGYLPRALSIFLLLASTIFEIEIFENFLIPWTTTLSTALLATGILGLIWVQEIKAGKRSHLQTWQLLFVAGSLGLMVPTRPVDALIGMVIGCAFVGSYLWLPKLAAQRGIHAGKFLALASIGAVIGPAIFIGFNVLIYGSPQGSYLQVAGSNGFWIADLPEKFYSIWLNAQPLYGEVGAGLIQHYPWLLLSLAGLAWILLRGDFVLRTIAIAMTLFFVLYLPYGDLLPGGMWRYLNIHYFKWTIPFFALFACLLLAQIVRGVQVRSGWQLPSALLIGVPLLLLCIQMRIVTAPLSVNLTQARTVTLELPQQAIDLVDVKGLTGNFASIYFGVHVLSIDGKTLKINRDYRLLEHGGDIRILFIRPVQGHTLELLPDARLQLHNQQLNAQWANYYFSLGLPTFAHQLPFQAVPAAYRLNQVIDFSNQGISQFYIAKGFSIPESLGRWTMGESALIDLRVMNLAPEKKAQLVLRYKALVTSSKPCQQVIIRLNQQPIGSNRLCLENQGDEVQVYRYDIPLGAIGKEGLVQIQIDTPDSVSPRQLNMNTDERKLGVFLQTLVMTQ
jgi:hypothetical protein